MRRQVTPAELQAEIAKMLQDDVAWTGLRLPGRLEVRERRSRNGGPNWSVIWLSYRVSSSSSSLSSAIRRAVSKAEAQYHVAWRGGNRLDQGGRPLHG